MFASSWASQGGHSAAGDTTSWKGIIDTSGVGTNLVLCLDAGNADSYTSGQKWLDQTANGYDFDLGAGSGASTDDPTYNGTPGDESATEFWSFDGGDLFTYDTTNETWMNDMHQDSASFTIGGWFYPGTTADDHNWFGTGAGISGIAVKTFASGTSRINVYNSSTSILEETSTAAIADSAWHFFLLTIDEAAGTGFWYFDGAEETFTSTYGTADTGASANPMEIGGRPGSGSPDKLLSGDRMAGFFAWDTALTVAEADTLWTAMNGARF